MQYTLTAGMVLGVGLGLTPGPVVAEIVRRGTSGGLRPALGVAAGALAGNILSAALAAVGAGALLALPRVAPVVTMVGAAWIAYLGGDSWRQAGRMQPERSAPARPVGSSVPAWLAGLGMVLANPLVWAFWVAALAAAGRAGAHAGPLFAVGFVCGISASDVALAMVSSHGGRWLGARGQAIALRVCALLLVGFAAWSVARVLAAH